MRALAEFVMRGRAHAAALAVLALLTISWLGAAIIGLVTLRKGVAEGALLMLWCLIPAVGAWLGLQDFMPLATVLSVTACCIALRLSQSWQMVALTAALGGYITATLLLNFAPDYLAAVLNTVQETYSAVFAELEKELSRTRQVSAEELSAFQLNAVFIAGFFGVMQVIATLIACLLARYWQAMLYNPGGFRQEFHRIQLSPALATGLLGVAALCMTQNWISWAGIAALPLLMAGIALIHGLVGVKKLQVHWLVGFYIILVSFNELKLFIVLLAVVDSFFGFRQRLLQANRS